MLMRRKEATEMSKRIRIPKRPFIIVTLEGNKDLVHDVKAYLGLVLEWLITEDKERYSSVLDHAVKGENADVRSSFLLIKKYNPKEGEKRR